MSQASELLRLGQAAHAAQFPAEITIDGQAYDAATSGERRESQLVEGGTVDVAVVSFWLPVSAFTAAAEPLPIAQTSEVTWSDRVWQIDSVVLDPVRITVTLRCSGPRAV